MVGTSSICTNELVSNATLLGLNLNKSNGTRKIFRSFLIHYFLEDFIRLGLGLGLYDIS